MKRQFFTLAELAAIVSALTVLSGMAIPIFKSAHEQSIDIVCSNHLRLLHSATFAYNDDWGSLPAVGFDPKHLTVEDERHDEMATAVLLHGAFGSNNGYLPRLEERSQTEQVYFCPAAYPHRESGNGSDYGVNVALFRRINHGKLEGYPDAIMFADGYGDYHLMREYNWIGYRWRHGMNAGVVTESAPVVNWAETEIRGRYGDGDIQSIFVDGSVHTFNYSQREKMFSDHVGIVPDDRSTY